MLSYLKGNITEIEEERVVIEVGGVGFGVFMPLRDIRMLEADGRQVKVFTHLNVREDAMQLFGFLNKDDLAVFRLLLTVSGIGPKGAIGVLSALSADDLRFAVLSDDLKTIQTAPGIGKKTAQKLILELKDKLKLEDVLPYSAERSVTVAGPESTARAEVIEALTALGYSGTDAVRAVNAVEQADTMTVEELLKAALSHIFL